MPQRIQRKRTKGWSTPLCSCGCGRKAIYVGRPSRWGNPFAVVPEPHHPRWAGPRHSVIQTPDGRIWPYSEIVEVTIGRDAAERKSKQRAAQAAVDLFALHIGPMGSYEYSEEQLAELRSLAGHDLTCWCPLDSPCHGDVLLELANDGAT